MQYNAIRKKGQALQGLTINKKVAIATIQRYDYTWIFKSIKNCKRQQKCIQQLKRKTVIIGTTD